MERKKEATGIWIGLKEDGKILKTRDKHERI
jgi:hypothetical protein